MTKPATKYSDPNTPPTELNWRTTLSHAFRHSEELVTALGLTPDNSVPMETFPMRVPRGFAERMQPGHPNDPLLRQVLPSADELRTVDGYSADPVGDLDNVIPPGGLQKYRGRALLIVTGACAIHCRYCFRRAYPYASGSLSGQDFQTAMDVLTADPTIEEVVLSGGDPLTLTNDKLATLFNALTRIKHIKRIRIHTRIPIALPERIDSQLLDLISINPRSIIVVIHCNHAREIDDTVTTAVSKLNRAGAVMLNQSVLLHGVNDSIDTLVDLSERLFDIGVLPYYLHQLDPVAGAAHFNVTDNRSGPDC
ncbi:MAG: EF-P beta-lysylation protein EpmB [Gammaproteobacteria bacterium]|jgi:EF-P beta-lysylation protein EpmB|nr:EF-P beta-lysylation protein EpmB [Chromatiales bacterium]MDP6674953.1 EF-P beta-lysylation protein EpmB [Gammaproteobacteria bacterium]